MTTEIAPAKKRGRPADPNKIQKQVTHRPVSVKIESNEGDLANVTQEGRLFRVMTLDGQDITSSVEWKTKMKARKLNVQLQFANGAWDVAKSLPSTIVLQVGQTAFVKKVGRRILAFTPEGVDITAAVPSQIRLRARNEGAEIKLTEDGWAYHNA